MSNKLISLSILAAISLLSFQIAKGGHGFDLLLLVVLYELHDIFSK